MLTNARIGATSAQRPARPSRRSGSTPRPGRFAGERFSARSPACAAGQERRTGPVRRPRLERQFRRQRHQRHLHRRQGGDRQVPLLLSEASGQVAHYRGDVTRRCARNGLRSLPQPALLSARERRPAPDHRRRSSPRQRHAASTPASGTPGDGRSISSTACRTARAMPISTSPGLTFGPGFQPDELTRLTQGVIALVNGTISGRGRIDWSGERQGHLDRRFLDRRTRPRGAVRPGHRDQGHDPLQRSARAHDRRPARR